MKSNPLPNVSDTPMHLMCKMKSGLSDGDHDTLLERGIGVIDYDGGPCVNASHIDDEGANTAYSIYRKFTRRGGYAAIANEGNTKIAVGRAIPPTGMFLPVTTTGGNETQVKAFQLDEYAVLSEENDDFEQEVYQNLRKAVENRGQQGALTTFKSKETGIQTGREDVLGAFHALEDNADIIRS